MNYTVKVAKQRTHHVVWDLTFINDIFNYRYIPRQYSIQICFEEHKCVVRYLCLELNRDNYVVIGINNLELNIAMSSINIGNIGGRYQL